MRHFTPRAHSRHCRSCDCPSEGGLFLPRTWDREAPGIKPGGPGLLARQGPGGLRAPTPAASALLLRRVPAPAPGQAAQPRTPAPPAAGGPWVPCSQTLCPPARSQETTEGTRLHLRRYRGPFSFRRALLTTHESSRAAELAGQRSQPPAAAAALGTGSTSSLRARHFRRASRGCYAERLPGSRLSSWAGECGEVKVCAAPRM